MKTIKKRLHKKMHRRWLDYFGDEVSFSFHWRALLFAAEEGMAFPIDQRNHGGLSPDAVEMLNKYGLRFLAARVDPSTAPHGLGDYGEVFKVWAADYPTLVFWTANNPDVIYW